MKRCIVGERFIAFFNIVFECCKALYEKILREKKKIVEMATSILIVFLVI